MQILLVEDDPNLAKILLTIFKNSSYKTIHASNIADGLKAALSQSFDVMIFDWMLQDETGIELLKEVRAYDIVTPVLMLTAVSATEEKVFALDLGADDYLTKPFLTEELLARIRALTRRESSQKQSVVALGSLTLNSVQRKIFDDGKALELTAKEFCLLEYMMRNKKTVFTREQLAEQINRDFEYTAASNVIDVHIRNIRKKISNPNLIESVYGVGYRVLED